MPVLSQQRRWVMYSAASFVFAIVFVLLDVILWSFSTPALIVAGIFVAAGFGIFIAGLLHDKRNGGVS